MPSGLCGRFALFARHEDLARVFGVSVEDEALPPRYNIAPTQAVSVVRASDGRRQLVPMHWGLIPSWAKDATMGSGMISARTETVAEKPAFRSAFKARRCLIPASGFYEWQVRGRGKVPHFIRRADAHRRGGVASRPEPLPLCCGAVPSPPGASWSRA
jgi:putative SOS response-associated peptidase YedK